MMDPSTIVWWT